MTVLPVLPLDQDQHVFGVRRARGRRGRSSPVPSSWPPCSSYRHGRGWRLRRRAGRRWAPYGRRGEHLRQRPAHGPRPHHRPRRPGAGPRDHRRHPDSHHHGLVQCCVGWPNDPAPARIRPGPVPAPTAPAWTAPPTRPRPCATRTTRFPSTTRPSTAPTAATRRACSLTRHASTESPSPAAAPGPSQALAARLRELA
jgi:hypothetical protein